MPLVTALTQYGDVPTFVRLFFYFWLDFTIKMVLAEKHLKETNEKERWNGICDSHS